MNSSSVEDSVSSEAAFIVLVFTGLFPVGLAEEKIIRLRYQEAETIFQLSDATVNVVLEIETILLLLFVIINLYELTVISSLRPLQMLFLLDKSNSSFSS